MNLQARMSSMVLAQFRALQSCADLPSYVSVRMSRNGHSVSFASFFVVNKLSCAGSHPGLGLFRVWQLR